MKIIILVAIALIWMIFASIPRGGDDKKSSAWLDEIAPPKASPLAVASPTSQASPQATQAPQTEAKPSPSPSASPSPSPKPQAEKPKPSSPSGQKLVCRKSGDADRTLILSTARGGCELVYEKPDSSERV